MALGLKRGIVELADHDPEWETLAANTIERLRHIFGSVAKDIQHVGSTAIRGIKAKPIIDIAVAVYDFDKVEDLTLVLEVNGFLRRSWNTNEQLLYAVGDYSKPNGVVTHFIHIVKTDSVAWHDYINFRNYLNASFAIAKSYESLKIKLAKENPHDKGREKYLAGKYGFIKQTLQEALTWSCIHDIPGYTDFIKIEPVNKGWSSDKKYYIETADVKHLLLRVADVAEYDRKKNEFDMMRHVAALGIPMTQPVDFGVCNSGKSVYQLLTWIDGEDAEKMLPLLSETEQYVLGLKAGKILKQMQSLFASPTSSNWLNGYGRKIDGYINQYKECGMPFEGDNYFFEYIAANRHLMDNRSTCFSHDDYHPGNMILTGKNELYIIDFQRFREVEPYHAMSGLVFTAAYSPHFATGQIHGYFEGDPPMEFWRLLALYMSAIAVNALPWSIPFGQEEINFANKQINNILHWFNNMQTPVPIWYLKDFYIQWTDGVPYKLKAPFDFSFLNKYGKVFKVFDDQDSGNICFGVANGDKRYFVKFAGAPTERTTVRAKEAIVNLKRTVPIYEDLAHPNLIQFVSAEEIGGGFAMAFEWVDTECMGRMYPLSRQKFMKIPLETKVKVFEDILEFHAYVHTQGYVAIDFYDGSVMYDFINHKTVICDIDFYAVKPYRNNIGRLWGSSRFMSPEEYILGADIDEVTSVYTMGAMAFALFSDYDRLPEAWPLNKALYAVVKKAVSDIRGERQQTIEQLILEWRAARE